MAKQLGVLNPGFAGSTISLDRRSNTSINAIDNAMSSDGASENPYNTLQRNNIHNVKPTKPQRVQNALYDDIGPGLRSKNNSKASQTSKKLGRARQRKRERIVRAVLMFLIVFVAVIALLLALLLMMGKVGPKCSCGTSDSSPRAGKLTAEEPTQQSNTSQTSENTFTMDFSPFYDILEDLQANISSLQKEAQSIMKESEGNKDSLLAAKTEFNSTREAVRLFSNQFYAVVEHVNSSLQQFNHDDGPVFNRLQALNSTLSNKLAEMKQTYEHYNNAIDNAVESMNQTIAEKVAIKIAEPGPVGERGQNGSKGPTGQVGPTGLKGPTGIKGLKGSQGDKGSPGDPGYPGTNGRKGATGDTGDKGPQGDDGTTGIPGEIGDQGPRGIGNFSWCQLMEIKKPQGQIVSVSDSLAQNVKVVGAFCTTDTALESNLQVTESPNANEYKCVCEGGTAAPNCILYYWKCPIQAP